MWQAAPERSICVYLIYRMTAPQAIAKVITNNEIAADAYILQLERNFDFEAGQVISLSIDRAGPARMYSIASGDHESCIDILYTRKPDGLLTPDLARLKAGDMLYRSEPFGKFLGHRGRALWIAAGTGIAPFVSQASSGYAEGKTLIYGGRTPDRLFYHDRMKAILGDRYISCCSGVNKQGHFFGRVTDFLTDWPDLDTSLPAYLCGSAEMVVDVRDLLIEKGVAFDRIMAEIFF